LIADVRRRQQVATFAKIAETGDHLRAGKPEDHNDHNENEGPSMVKCIDRKHRLDWMGNTEETNNPSWMEWVETLECGLTVSSNHKNRIQSTRQIAARRHHASSQFVGLTIDDD